MSELKTKPNDDDVDAFLNSIDGEARRADCDAILKMMKQATRAEPKMWGDSIIGFGSYHYKTRSGREGDWFLTGFSPRKQNLTLYVIMGFDQFEELMASLGKFKTGKSCLYIKRLSDVDTKVLKKLITEGVKHLKKHGGSAC